MSEIRNRVWLDAVNERGDLSGRPYVARTLLEVRMQRTEESVPWVLLLRTINEEHNKQNP